MSNPVYVVFIVRGTEDEEYDGHLISHIAEVVECDIADVTRVFEEHGGFFGENYRSYAQVYARGDGFIVSKLSGIGEDA